MDVAHLKEPDFSKATKLSENKNRWKNCYLFRHHHLWTLERSFPSVGISRYNNKR